MPAQVEMLEPAADAPSRVLVVDLDGTLIRTDMLYETFWAALSKRWLNVVPALRALQGGRAALKRTLEGMAEVDPAALPLNEDVLARVRRWREDGGRTALVSASDQRLVERIADHVGLFDDAHGSDGTTNLKGPEKARLLAERFPEGFAYMGDAHADYTVWEKATRAITVDVAPALRARVDALTVESEHLTTRGSLVRPLLKAMRPHQWLKNVLVFLPVLAAHQFDLVTIGRALLAFTAYSLIASSVYLLNDLLDLASDRAHPRKRARPFASGALPLAWGTALAPGLLAGGVLVSLLLGPAFLGVMAFYYAVTTAYSFNLKRRLVVDICTLAGLYTLRIIAGGVATGIPLSVWLLAFSMFFFFALAAMKRQAELVSGAAAGEEKAHGRGYMTSDLPLVANMAVSSGYVSVLVLALWLDSSAVRELYSETAPLWGICLILLYWISRMVMITHRGWMHDDPVVFAARDRNSILCGALIFVLAVAGIVM
jgi:4-hydroxybenzoate polyprenyltransferase/phosphoserine phosphatase